MSSGTLTALARSPIVKVYAANGSGTMKVSPTTVTAGSEGITLTFTYTAAVGGTTGGEIELVVPAGWSVPSTIARVAGYVTSTCGKGAISGSTVEVRGVNLAAARTCTITYGSKVADPERALRPLSAQTSSGPSRHPLRQGAPPRYGPRLRSRSPASAARGVHHFQGLRSRSRKASRDPILLVRSSSGQRQVRVR